MGYSLDVIQVPDPCPEKWATMRGDDEVRHCDVCEKNVYNLSAMTRQRAEALLTEREGQLCVRFYRRADGTVTTVDCAPIRFAKVRAAARRTLIGAAAMFVALVGLVTSLGLFRLSGLMEWVESSAIGDLAKSSWIEPEVEMAGEPAYHDVAPVMGAEAPMPEDAPDYVE